MEVFEPFPQTICFRVSGEMGPRQAVELESAWIATIRQRAGKTCIVDLSRVTHLDHASGVPMLRRLVRQGVNLKVPPEALHYLISVIIEEEHHALVAGERDFRSSIFMGDLRPSRVSEPPEST